MLKAELQRRLDAEESAVVDLRNERFRILRESKEKDKEIKNLENQNRYFTDQMKQISQSVYTVLQIKYPETRQHELTFSEQAEISEDQRLLMFIHGLCVDRNYNLNQERLF